MRRWLVLLFLGLSFFTFNPRVVPVQAPQETASIISDDVLTVPDGAQDGDEGEGEGGGGG